MGSEFGCVTKGGRKSKGIGPLKEGILSSTGYSVKKTTQKRHKSLNKLVRKEGALKAFRQLNAVAVYNKYSSPRKSKTFKRDRNWVRRKFMKS
jgi:hypothetical protein